MVRTASDPVESPSSPKKRFVAAVTQEIQSIAGEEEKRLRAKKIAEEIAMKMKPEERNEIYDDWETWYDEISFLKGISPDVFGEDAASAEAAAVEAAAAEAAAYERIKRKISAPQQLESAYTLFYDSWGHRTDMQGKAIEDKLKAHIENMKNDAAPERTDYLKQDRIHAENVCEICPKERGEDQVNFTQKIMGWNTAVDNASDLGLTKEQLDSAFTDHETKPYVTVTGTGQLHLIKFCDQCLSWNEWFGGDAASSPRISDRNRKTVLTSDGHILQSNPT